MAKWIRSQWNPDFAALSPLFYPLSVASSPFALKTQWPDLDDYNDLILQHNPVVRSELGAAIQFVRQAEKPTDWRQDYEPRIYLNGEVQTRTENWHDFFQVLVWYCLPQTKSILNALHFESIKQRNEQDSNNKQRSELENSLTQFDECGAIITSSDPSLLTLIENFQWKTLFWHRRNELKHHLRCFVFGHAIYEKALNPYPGLTSHCILLHTSESFNQQELVQQLKTLDTMVSKKFSNLEFTNPQQYNPFPLLGMPDWTPENEQESYYDNHQYFRSGRQRQIAIL